MYQMQNAGCSTTGAEGWLEQYSRDGMWTIRGTPKCKLSVYSEKEEKGTDNDEIQKQRTPDQRKAADQAGSVPR